MLVKKSLAALEKSWTVCMNSFKLIHPSIHPWMDLLPIAIPDHKCISCIVGVSPDLLARFVYF